jgi:hypothetical protein
MRLHEHIVKVGKKYRLLSHKGKNLGTFDSYAAAAKHEGEVEYFKTHESFKQFHHRILTESLEWVNTRPQLASDLPSFQHELPPFPVKRYRVYHVTPRKNVEAILTQGFDLHLVKPRWVNDYAVSFSRGLKSAQKYFAKTGQEMNVARYAVLEVVFRGRLFTGQQFDAPAIRAASPQDYRYQALAQGLDGLDGNSFIYLYNPKCILTIREVPV